MDEILEAHIEPDKDVMEVHNSMVDQLIEFLQNSLPPQHWIFEGCELKMFGSFGSSTKICEFDEYDINIVLKLAFDQTDTNWMFVERNVKDEDKIDIKPNPVDIAILREHVSEKCSQEIFRQDQEGDKSEGKRWILSSTEINAIFRKAIIIF